MLKTHVLLISINLMSSSVAMAIDGIGGLFYFFDGQDIDYWREGKAVREHLSIAAPPVPTVVPTPEGQQVAAFSGSTQVRDADAKPFSWSNYKNVRSPEFWDDGGDWIPPRPFREAAANPSKENVNEYLEWLGRKTLVVNRFQAALTTVGANKHPAKTQREGQAFAWSSLRIAYFYQSSCAHCRASAPVVEEAKRLGAQVSFIQLDAKQNPPLHSKSIAYDASWAKNFPMTATPTWILKLGKATETVTGSLSLEELITKLNQLATQGKDK